MHSAHCVWKCAVIFSFEAPAGRGLSGAPGKGPLWGPRGPGLQLSSAVRWRTAVAWWAVRRYELSYRAASAKKLKTIDLKETAKERIKMFHIIKGGWCSGPPMPALGPLLLSLGRFLRSHWAGFSQSKTELVESRGLFITRVYRSSS